MSCSQNDSCEKTAEDAGSSKGSGPAVVNESVGLNSGGGEGVSNLKQVSSRFLQQPEEVECDKLQNIKIDHVQEVKAGQAQEIKVDQVQEVKVDNKVDIEGSSKNVEVTKTENEIENDTCRVSGRETQAEAEEAESNETVFRRPKRKNSNRVYRTRRSDGNSSPDDDDEQDETWPTTGSQSRDVTWEGYSLSSSSTSSSSSSLLSLFDNRDADMLDDKDTTNLPRVLTKPRPRHKWFVVQEVINRQLGVGSKYVGSELFQQRCYGSLHAVQRLELMYKLEAHRGCVNALNFNQSGSLLATASDDRKVALWDWALGKCVFTYDSGHSSNVFQARFLPLSGDRHIVSCARDGHIRLAVLSGTGVCRSTRLLAQHRRPAHKIATQNETPHVFLSAGEDAVVMSFDVREHNHKKLLICKEGTERIALYSVHSNPINCHEFCITGDDHFIRLYDKRKISADGGCLKKFCPQHLVKSEVFIHVTCAVFNYNGTEILGSFNDEDIYLFDTRHSDGADYVHRYEGHRNSVTVKGVNFFGPRSEYIVSGSDCGNIFFWDKHTEGIVQWMRGDEEGVVNCLEPHPQVPMIATSGLDYDIKIWVPSCEQEPTFNGLKSSVIFNQKTRDENKSRRGDPWDSQMQWLWRQIRRFERRRGIPTESRPETRTQGEGDAAPASAVSEESSSTEEDGNVARPECSPS
ncbi:DDB1- and CUL4-associated factor 8-like [Lycorma delicatula]|uniref:DDB1- and CUL4-associated factor 8-like n=1 Tax=Lycorma delicatula TaxID=130591 RepID=UPI003F515229